MKNYYIASSSFGKDSLAMLLLLLKTGAPLDEVVFANTGMEFHSTILMRDRFLTMLRRDYPQIKYVELDVSEEFRYNMFDKPVYHRKGEVFSLDAEPHRVGFGWCGGACRWGTSLKFGALRKHYNELKKDKVQFSDGIVLHEYVGIAADELERLERETTVAAGVVKHYPLVEAGLSESACLRMCYDAGFDWAEEVVDLQGVHRAVRLYEDLVTRGSCYCCRNKNLKEMNNIYHLAYNSYFIPLLEMQKQIPEKFYQGRESVPELAERFSRSGLQMHLDFF